MPLAVALALSGVGEQHFDVAIARVYRNGARLLQPLVESPPKLEGQKQHNTRHQQAMSTMSFRKAYLKLFEEIDKIKLMPHCPSALPQSIPLSMQDPKSLTSSSEEVSQPEVKTRSCRTTSSMEMRSTSELMNFEFKVQPCTSNPWSSNDTTPCEPIDVHSEELSTDLPQSNNNRGESNTIFDFNNTEPLSSALNISCSDIQIPETCQGISSQEIKPPPTELRIMCQNRDILDLGQNIRSEPFQLTTSLDQPQLGSALTNTYNCDKRLNTKKLVMCGDADCKFVHERS